tara:strand:- start:1277 stop:1564 length:288 start_codon:yes stop_codon:yes gene_type:complete
MSETLLPKMGSEDIISRPVDIEVDAAGLSCPMPLLKARQGLNKLQSGQTLRLLATDTGSVRDVKSFAELSGNQILSFAEAQRETAALYVYILQKA